MWKKFSPSTSCVVASSPFTPKRNNASGYQSISDSQSITDSQGITDSQSISDSLYKTATEGVEEEKQASVIVNPFDVKAESLHFSTCSPSVFATFTKNKKYDGTFKWSIEHLSLLYPAEIDESSLPEPKIDFEQEKRAQQAIDTFFSQNSIVPSPWSDAASSKQRNELKMHRKSRVGSMFEPMQGTEVSTQTQLSIPPDVDLSKILGDFFTCDQEEESFYSRENSQNEADMSTSSLRRKLFVADGEEEEISPSTRQKNELQFSEIYSTPTTGVLGSYSTPQSDVLSSSPITPPHCSELCNILSPPPLSPISVASSSPVVQHRPTTVRTMLDSTAFNDNAMSFVEANSEKADTGYVTGSISDNMTRSENVTHWPLSRISTISELMEECDAAESTPLCVLPAVAKYEASLEGVLQAPLSQVAAVVELMEESGLSNTASCDMSYDAAEYGDFVKSALNDCNPGVPSYTSTPTKTVF